MITSGLVVDGVGHGLPTHLPYNHPVHNRMSYMEPPYLKAVPVPSSQSAEPVASATPEFLRPLPKPAPVNPLKVPRASKYPLSSDGGNCRPVNLTQAKEPPLSEHLRMDDRHHPYSTMYGHPRLYVSASPYHSYPMPAPYGVYTSPYTPVVPRDTRHHLMQPPQERRYPSPPTKSSRTSPLSSPPEQFKVPNGRDKSVSQQQPQPKLLPPPPPPVLPPPAVVTTASAEPPLKKIRTTPEPSSPPAKTSNFTKGSLIRLANGHIKKVEDMRTEDFLSSVENSDKHRIDPSTVVRIEPVMDAASAKGSSIIRITLSYGDQRNRVGADNKRTLAPSKSHQVEMESGAEHPYFVFGRGWASWSPSKTLAKYGLTCQRLQVGDVCVSLSKRSDAAAYGKRRQQLPATNAGPLQQPPPPQTLHHHQQSAGDDKKTGGRNKRRWSAPDPEPAT
ncbi:ataxin-1-like [Daktulosphaira vitifoliae]|uniref:ataxin-1-like n=1 Tax=Daktulosphaira vitifoliae TaxID=58002 RepID=UPI0021AA93A2|nr:ataxin-1-like [Daktulosphaira vitifoliae]XP_050545288.1 ataxin-1-like [Daktulosphaira vitifoliae]